MSSAFLMSPVIAATFLAQNWIAAGSRILNPSPAYGKEKKKKKKNKSITNVKK